MPAPELPPKDLADLAARGPLTLLDVREPFERGICKIEVPPSINDVHVPLGQVVERLALLRETCEGRPLVVYCHHGVRSRIVVDWLVQQGFGDLYNLSGGIDAWSLEVDPRTVRY